MKCDHKRKYGKFTITCDLDILHTGNHIHVMDNLTIEFFNTGQRKNNRLLHFIRVVIADLEANR